jgi:hypothetical protein
MIPSSGPSTTAPFAVSYFAAAARRGAVVRGKPLRFDFVPFASYTN